MQPNASAPPIVREPHWPMLAVDLNWLGLWASPESPLVKRIVTLEARLHSLTNNDPADMVSTKAQLAAFAWLRETVEEQARTASDRARSHAAAAEETTKPRRRFWNLNAVTPRLG